jgi:hypothetical protein
MVLTETAATEAGIDSDLKLRQQRNMISRISNVAFSSRSHALKQGGLKIGTGDGRLLHWSFQWRTATKSSGAD